LYPEVWYILETSTLIILCTAALKSLITSNKTSDNTRLPPPQPLLVLLKEEDLLQASARHTDLNHNEWLRKTPETYSFIIRTRSLGPTPAMHHDLSVSSSTDEWMGVYGQQ